MGQTWKDSTRKATHRTVLEVAANADGTYEIIVNGEVVEAHLREMARRRSFAQNEDSAERSLSISAPTSGAR